MLSNSNSSNSFDLLILTIVMFVLHTPKLLDGLNNESKGEQWKEKDFFLCNLILEKLFSVA